MDFLRHGIVLEVVESLWLHQATAPVDPEARLVRICPRLVWVTNSGCILDPNDGDFVTVAKVLPQHQVNGFVSSYVEEDVCMTVWLQQPGGMHEHLIQHIHDFGRLVVVHGALVFSKTLT